MILNGEKMKEKTELLFLAQDADKLTEIVDYLIRKEICDGAHNLQYISTITASLGNCTRTLLKLVEKMNDDEVQVQPQESEAEALVTQDKKRASNEALLELRIAGSMKKIIYI